MVPQVRARSLGADLGAERDLRAPSAGTTIRPTAAFLEPVGMRLTCETETDLRDGSRDSTVC